MNISQRLRTCAKHTGLDAVIELLQEAADEIDALQARAQVHGEPVCGSQNPESAPQAPLSLTAAPQPATPDDMKVYDSIADRYFREATQAAVPMTPREIELIDGMIEVQLDHAQRCDAISNRAMAEKQKGWDMERVELLRRIRSFGITAQAKKETP